jgi:hypothetical protein
MVDLVTLDEACANLRLAELPVAGSLEALDLQMKISQASEAVLLYVTETDKADWTAATVPQDVKGATLVLITALYDDRTGKTDNYFKEGGAVANLLRRRRDPPIA